MILVTAKTPSRSPTPATSALRGGGGGVPPKKVIAAAPDDDRDQHAAGAVDLAFSCDWRTIKTMKMLVKKYRRQITPWGVIYEPRY